MNAASVPRGTGRQRLAIHSLTVLFAILLFWLLGFLVRDLAEIPGPSYPEIEARHLDAALISKAGALKVDLARIERLIREQQHEQRILRDGTGTLERTINQLLDLQRTSVQQNRKLSAAEEKAFTDSMDVFLLNQKRDQAINQEIARLTMQQNSLDAEDRLTQEQIEQQREPARKEHQQLLRRHQHRVAFLQLAVLLPLLAGSGWILFRWRSHLHFPLAMAAGLSILARVGLVIHHWFPSRLFRYILLGAAMAVVVRLLIAILRLVARPPAEWLLKRYREAYERFFCPVCDYPIRRGPMRFRFWTRRSLSRLHLPADEAAFPDSRYTCPHCGTPLFEECPDCHFIRHTLLPFCDHCGDRKEPAR